MKYLLTILISAFVCLGANAQKYSNELLKRANEGDAVAMNDLGECYYWGEGIVKDLAKAAEWFLKAAQLGNKDAMYSIGTCYQWGEGVEKNDYNAVFWYKKGAEAGSKEAMFNLGVCYRKGIGVPEDSKSVFYWWQKSAQLDYLPAMNNLGLCYRRGIGVDQDYDKAVEWYRKAAMTCDQNSVNNLAVCFKAGWGVEKNEDIANSLMIASNASTESEKESLRKFISDLFPDAEKNEPLNFDPPILKTVSKSIKFIDENGNNAIDGGEDCKVCFAVRNYGRGDARNCVAKISTTSENIIPEDVNIDLIRAGETREVSVPLKGSRYLTDGRAKLKITLYEPSGCGTDMQLTINTNAFVSPLIKVVDYAVTNQSGAELTKMQPFNIKMIVQNIKPGTAEDVSVSIDLPQNILVVDGSKTLKYPVLKGGDKMVIDLCVMATNNYNESVIPVNVNINEKYGQYAENKTINLTMNQPEAENNIVIEEINTGDVEIAKIEGKRELSDVDKNIPHNDTDNTSTFAVVIANENYRQVPKVAYAINDGTMFATYCHEVLGIPEKNIRLVKDATLNEIRGGINWLRKVADAYSGDADIIFYYAGHGVPDQETSEVYILPTDGYSTDLITAYRMNDLYAALSECPSKGTLVFLDACFSGTDRCGENMEMSRAVGIKPRKSEPKGNMVVFSAAKSFETAHPYEEKHHGLFTYYLLKKLQMTAGDVTLGELDSYLKDKVNKMAVINKSKEQRPEVQASPELKNKWKDKKMR